MKLTNPHEHKHYDQEHQKLDVRFAFIVETLPKEYVTLHNFVKCRDFLSDVIYWKQRELSNIKIYGFSLTNIELEQVSNNLAIRAEPKLLDKLLQNINYASSYISNCKRIDDSTLILFINRAIIANPINISLFSLIMKVLTIIDINKNFKNEIKLLPAKEQDYINKIGINFFETLLVPGKIPYQMKFPLSSLYWDDINTYKLDPHTLHENIGIVSIFNTHSPNSNIKRHFRQLKKQTEDNEKSTIKNNPRNVTYTTNTIILDELAAANLGMAAAVNPVLDFLHNPHQEAGDID